ncbi:MAG: hypothetical protein ACE5FL_15595, partial [Myxococcota bacterium]
EEVGPGDNQSYTPVIKACSPSTSHRNAPAEVTSWYRSTAFSPSHHLPVRRHGEHDAHAHH